MTELSTTIPATAPPPPRGGPVRTSRRAKWRAIVLIGVHLAVAVHVALWLALGSTVTPVEPSESMETLQTGAVNAGFVFFVLAILATLVLGRFFCGWACHVVAYQDFCAWVLKKLGLKPKPVRSRLLIWVPLGVAIYMFVWPQLLRWFGTEPAMPRELRAEFTTTRFWETFAGPGMALLTLFVCGFIVVWWFGAKGFCTYGCPYGGFFAVADKFATGRIRVTDACRGCRHCTATCTSNVLVHEEVLKYGMVVDPGCMKCMDCISVCPENALYFGFGKWSLGAVKGTALGSVRGSDVLMFAGVFALTLGFWLGTAELSGNHRAPAWLIACVSLVIATALTLSGRSAAKKYDFTRGEEFAMAAVFLVTAEWSFRALYNKVPHLLAIGLGAVTAIVAIIAWRVVRGRDVTIQHTTLRQGGALTSKGRWFLAGAAVWALFVLHSSFVQYHAVRANALVEAASQIASEEKEKREPLLDRSLAHIAAFDRFAPFDDSNVRFQAGHIAFTRGDLDGAEKNLRRAIEILPKNPGWQLMLADTLAFRRDLDGAVRVLEDLIARYPEELDAQIRLADAFVGQRDAVGAERTLRAVLVTHPNLPQAQLRLADLHAMKGEAREATAILLELHERFPDDAAVNARLQSLGIDPKGK